MWFVTETVSGWRDELGKPGFRRESAATMALLAAVLAGFARFVMWVESRPGVELRDPILQLFQPINLTWLTFVMIYVGLLTALLYLIRFPRACLSALQAYMAMILVRMLVMWVLPLNPPASMIVLKDPLVEFFGSGQSLTRDLFFSGHTATMFLLSLVCPHPFLKKLFVGLTMVVGVCVVAQHVHYAIDVIAAPFFAYGAFRLVGLRHLQKPC